MRYQSDLRRQQAAALFVTLIAFAMILRHACET